MKHFTLVAFSAILFAMTPVIAGATTIELREHVEVLGVGELKVVPNEFVVHASIETFDKSLKVATADSDRSIAALFKDVGTAGVDRKYIVTDAISVNAVTEGYRQQGNFRRLGYAVTRDVMVVLHDARKIEAVMKALFGNGVDRLSLSTGHTQMSSLLEDAQLKATAAAKKKAGVLSSSLGRALGQAVAISEESTSRNEAQNFVYTADTPDLGETLSLGKIPVRAAVRVKFLLR